MSLLVVLVCSLLTFGVRAEQPAANSPEQPPRGEAGVVVDVRDLSRRSKASFDRLLSEAVANAVNKQWQELGITDQVELKFFGDLNRLVRMKGATTVTSVCLIKPGCDVARVRHVTFKEDERVAMRYTCVEARVTEAIAIVNSVDIDGDDLSVQEAFLRYTADGVWRRVE